MLNTVLSYFEEIAGKFPEKIAVSYRDECYTFDQLMTVSKQIGFQLNRFHYQNQPIGVIADRGIQTIAFFVGTLYSGNYYVPIDPDMPVAKKQAIIDDANIPVIFGLEESKHLVDELAFSGMYISLGSPSEEVCTMPITGEDDPIYMVYTSGSTGKPKGVLKSHKAVISFAKAYRDTFSLSSDEVIGNQTPFFFDASAKDIYMMLILGCTLEILPSTLFALPPELIDYLNAKKVTFASWVPTVLSLVAQLNPFSEVRPTTLKKVFFVGEVMPMKHLNKWRAALPNIQYVNLYGQSEIAGICCYYIVEGEFENTATLPMGKPLKNCQIYLLDNGQIITEPNHIGEMYIVSDSLAIEYYNDVEKTKNCFVYRDFGEGMVRAFKTGDLAQYDQCGNLLFASRTDFQIKHMGHRIELGEIEAVAGAIPEIVRCCCLYNNEKKKITFFCELVEGAEITPRLLREMLKKKLSSYMMPGKFIILDKLPLSANGKIDRQALKQQL